VGTLVLQLVSFGTRSGNRLQIAAANALQAHHAAPLIGWLVNKPCLACWLALAHIGSHWMCQQSCTALPSLKRLLLISSSRYSVPLERHHDQHRPINFSISYFWHQQAPLPFMLNALLTARPRESSICAAAQLLHASTLEPSPKPDIVDN
jgi:hypothetical protein